MQNHEITVGTGFRLNKNGQIFIGRVTEIADDMVVVKASPLHPTSYSDSDIELVDYLWAIEEMAESTPTNQLLHRKKILEISEKAAGMDFSNFGNLNYNNTGGCYSPV